MCYAKKRYKLRSYQLSGTIKNLEQLHSISNDPSVLDQMRPITQERDKILGEEIENKLRVMKQQLYEAEPKVSKLLAWRLRKQQAENTIHKIRDPITNKITNKLEEIQNAFEKYYELLCTWTEKAERLTIQKFLASLDLPSIGKNKNDSLLCEIAN